MASFRDLRYNSKIQYELENSVNFDAIMNLIYLKSIFFFIFY